MHLLGVNTVLLICVNITNVFGFYGLRNSYSVLLEDIRLPRIEVEEMWIDQPLDHFNDSDARTWYMRFFEGLGFWKKGGPIYLLIGGEAPVDARYLQTGVIYKLAEETHGALYMTEHRYYGQSMPFSELNARTLVYLSSQQALADIAKLLRNIKSLPQFNGSKVVVVGCSYAGNLAAWMRLLYSDLVDAAIASSAPVLAKADFFEYLETVGDNYKQYGTYECYDKIATKFNRYNQLFQTIAGINQLKKEEKICNSVDMSKSKNRQAFFISKIKHYMGLAQYGNPMQIKYDCSNMNNILNNMKSLSNDSLSLHEVNHCYTYYLFDSLIKSIKMYEEMAWFYQTCTEFGYYPTTTSKKQPFTKNIPLDMFYGICTYLYGADFGKRRVEEGVKKTNDMYGGLNPRVTKVVFVNGDMDPWHRLSVLQDLSKDTPAILVHGTTHCEDFRSESPTDPEELKETRKFVIQLIKTWIGESG